MRTRASSTNDGHALALALRNAYWAMHRLTNAALERHGVTADQFVLLKHLAEDEFMTQMELVRRAFSDANTVRPMLNLLERRELVSRKEHPSDRRAHAVGLTAKGRRLLSELTRDTEPARAKMIGAVKHGSARSLAENLSALTAALKTG